MIKIQKSQTKKLHPLQENRGILSGTLLRSFLKMSAIAALCTSSLFQTASAKIIVDSEEERDEAIRQIKASHFLSQATFGPTWPEIVALAEQIRTQGEQQAFEQWIDDQMAMPASLMLPRMMELQDDPERRSSSDDFDLDALTKQRGFMYYDYTVWERALTAKDQLRHRMSDALGQILVVGRPFFLYEKDSGRGLAIYQDIMVENAFGSYREILRDITYSPAMGLWLSSVKNKKQSLENGVITYPDENFARELLQLFTVGVYRMNEGGQLMQKNGDPVTKYYHIPEEIYDNETIKEYAKVFTGLTYALGDDWNRDREFSSRFSYFLEPMELDNNFHSEGSKKLLLDITTPGGQANGAQDIEKALTSVFWHKNCPPFISRLLIQRFTTSNPSTDYVRHVSSAFRNNAVDRGNLGRVIKAILMHSEARDSLDITSQLNGEGRWEIFARDKDTTHGKLKEPFHQITAMLRAFSVESVFRKEGDGTLRNDGSLRFSSTLPKLGQFSMSSPSVFNFYLPDYQPTEYFQHKLVAPEFEIATPSNINNLVNIFHDTMNGESSGGDHLRQFPTRMGYAELATVSLEDVMSRIDDEDDILNYLNILFCHGTMHQNSRKYYAEEILRSNNNNRVKVNTLITTILSSPDFAVNN